MLTQDTRHIQLYFYVYMHISFICFDFPFQHNNSIVGLNKNWKPSTQSYFWKVKKKITKKQKKLHAITHGRQVDDEFIVHSFSLCYKLNFPLVFTNSIGLSQENWRTKFNFSEKKNFRTSLWTVNLWWHLKCLYVLFNTCSNGLNEWKWKWEK